MHAAILIFNALAFGQLAMAAGSSVLWYSQPASDYNSALPIGNGRLGAMVYGLTDNETISLNEDSIYSGLWRNRVNPNSNATLPKVRALMDAGNLTSAGNAWLTGLGAVPDQQRYYQPAGSLNIFTGHNLSQVSNYNRSLDLTNGVLSTSYLFGGVTYARQAVANYPTGVLAFRFFANQAGKINLNITLQRAKFVSSTAANITAILLRGYGGDDTGFTFSSEARVVAKSGTISSSGASILVQNADEVQIFWDAETLYRYPQGSAAYEAALDSKLSSAVNKGFLAIGQEAIQDYQSLYSRASVSLGSSGNAGAVDTATRLSNLKNVNNFSQDPELLTLGYNFGRYAMISSSRPGSLPPNLQGNWNNQFNPPFGSKFTIDVNLQMNHWHAEVNGLSGIQQPLLDLMIKMQQRGSAVARDMYNSNGWTCHHNTDLWGDCAPQDSGTQWTIWPMGGTWLLAHLIDHYHYTGDKNFVTSAALPLMSGALDFYYNFTVLQNGHLQNYPSNSPENAYVIPQGSNTAGQATGIAKSTQMDRALLWNLATGFIELSAAVGSSAGVVQAQSFLSKLEPPSISAATGQMLEWQADYGLTDPGHRHFSPLFGLHPGIQYSPLTNGTLATAAGALLDYRMSKGSGSTGWSRIWASSLYSRLYQGDKAVGNIAPLFTGYMYSNLFTITSGVFQIDANFGLVNAVNEMFLQSNSRVGGNGTWLVHIGPAMPTSQVLQQGAFAGWGARGGFTVDATWSGGHITGANITSNIGGQLAVRVESGRQFKVNGVAYSGPLATKQGSVYTVSF